MQLILSGARGTLDIVFYPTRALGLGASFEYAEGAIYDDSHTVYRRLRAGPELTCWIGDRGWLKLSCAFSHTLAVHQPGDTSGTHELGVGFGLRFG